MFETSDRRRSSSVRSGRRAPGPSAFRGLRETLSFARDPLAFFLELQENWPVIARTSLGPIVLHTVFDTGLIREALIDHHDVYTKRGVIDELLPLLGDGLLASEGERWKGRRKGIAPLLAARAMEGFLPALELEVDALVTRWERAREQSQPVDASSDTMHLAIAVIGRALFGLDLSDRAAKISESVETISDLALRRSSSILKLPLAAPTKANRAYRHAIKELQDLVVAAVREGLAGGASMLSAMRELRDPIHGERLTEEELRDEAMSLLLAGHETTANTLAWTLDHLGRDPSLQERVRTEVREALRAPEVQKPLGLAPMPLLDAVVSESLRLAPPAWLVMRRALDAHVIGGYLIPKRSFMSVPVYAIHRNPKYWPEPDRFLPERFLEGEGEAQLDAFLPFGIGPRRCPGEAFTRAETRILLAKVLDRFELTLETPTPKAKALATLRPDRHVLVRLG